MTTCAENTTQELGVPITAEEQEKLLLLSDLQVLDLHDWLNPSDYPADRSEARAKFTERFAFYDLLALDRSANPIPGRPNLIKVYALWKDFMDWCACPPAILLDRKRYDDDLEVARCELEQRIMLWDCYKSNIVCHGQLRHGKSGYMCVHAWHGKEWFDIPIVCYKAQYNEEAFGDFIFLDESSLMKSVSEVSKIVSQKGKDYFQWVGSSKTDADKVKEEFMDKLNLRRVFIVIDEAHKVVGKDHRTLLSFFWEDRAQEWGHYQCGTVYITPEIAQLNRDRLQGCINVEISVSRNMDMPDTSNVRIYHRETGEHKPIIYFPRNEYYELWSHNAPIAPRSLWTSKDIRKAIKSQEEEDATTRPVEQETEEQSRPYGRRPKANRRESY